MSKLPTAEETLNKLGLNGGYYVEPKIAIQAIESHTAAHTAALREELKETQNIADGQTYQLKRLVKKYDALRERVKELEAEKARILSEVTEINRLAKETRVNVCMRIIELETENSQYKEALEKIADRNTLMEVGGGSTVTDQLLRTIAKKALEKITQQQKVWVHMQKK